MYIGDHSPWGVIQDAEPLGNGVFSVSTAGHGGIYVPPDQLHHIPKREQQYAAYWSGSKHWYEEDICCVSPLVHIPNIDKPEAERLANAYRQLIQFIERKK